MDEVRVLVKDELSQVEQSLSELIKEENIVNTNLKHFLMSKSKRIR